MSFRKPNRKPRANEAYLASQVPVHTVPYEEVKEIKKQIFLIICEGKNTEPSYFDGFNIPTVTTIGGKSSKNALVDYALEQQQDHRYKDHEIWCVFDLDVKYDEAETQIQDFNSSIQRAEAAGLKVAWSNDSFELWLLLHFQLVTTALHRSQFNKSLREEWKLKGWEMKPKKLAFCKEHYSRHLEGQKLALDRATVLHQQFAGRTDYAVQNPCTTVYLLVQELNKYLKS